MTKQFECYVCERDKEIRQKALVVGNGYFVKHICKPCARKHYNIWGAEE